jgi:hypothetical protein
VLKPDEWELLSTLFERGMGRGLTAEEVRDVREWATLARSGAQGALQREAYETVLEFQLSCRLERDAAGAVWVLPDVHALLILALVPAGEC